MIWNDASSPSLGLPPFSSSATQRPCLNIVSGAATSTPFPSTPLPSGPTPTSAQRFGTDLVPSLVNGYSASKQLCVGSSTSDDCMRSGGLQSSECMPRIGHPTQHQQTRTGHSQNNNVWTPHPCLAFSTAPSGSPGVAATTGTPRFASGQQPQPLFSQPVSDYSSMSYPPPPPPHSQVHTMPVTLQGAQTQPGVMFRMDAQQSFQPQPQPSQPRLRAPTAMHYCRPHPAGFGVGPAGCVSHPSSGVQRLQHDCPVLQSPSGQGQPPSMPTGHPRTHTMQPSHWPSQQPKYTSQGSMPHSSVTSQLSQGRPSSEAPCLHFQAPAQGIAPHLHEHCKNIGGGFGPQSWPETGDLVRGHNVPPHLPNSQPQRQTTYAQHPSDGRPEAPPEGQPAPSHPPSSGCVLTLPSAITHPGQGLQVGNDSTQGDNTSSGKSSDDSGLSVTPDRSNPSPKPATLASLGGEGTAAGGLKGVNWSGVPGEVVQLLVQQDAQLKVLQAQIQQLLAQQQQGPAPFPSTPTPSSADSTPSTVKRETCSTAVNTTLLQVESPWGRPAAAAHCVSIQTSPQKLAPPHLQRSPQSSPPPNPSHQAYASPQRLGSPFCHSTATHTAERNRQALSTSGTPCREEAASTGQTPSEIRHQGAVQLSSTQREDGMAATAGSFHSDISLEQPSPAR